MLSDIILIGPQGAGCPEVRGSLRASRRSLKVTFGFFGLPEWESAAWEVRKKGHYEQGDPSTRRRLEEYFEPHNQRLYEFLAKTQVGEGKWCLPQKNRYVGT